MTRTATLLACAATILGVLASSVAAKPTLIKSERLYVGNGDVIKNGAVLIDGGKIVSVGASIDAPDADVIEIESGSITPGLIDANARVEPTDVFPTGGRPSRSLIEMALYPDRDLRTLACHCSWHSLLGCKLADTHSQLAADAICPLCGYPAHLGVTLSSGVNPDPRATESSAEVVPFTSVLDTINLRSPDWDRLLAGGVTTVLAVPDSSAVIGPSGAVLKTAGPATRRVVERDGAVKASINSEPYSTGPGNSPPFGNIVNVRTRRPNTRMGVAWVFRKAFADAQAGVAGRDGYGADAPPPESLPVLEDLLAGKRPLMVHSRTQHDIEAALRLADEFGLTFTLLEGTEAYNVVPQLKAKNIPVVYGPVYYEGRDRRVPSNETQQNRFSTVRELVRSGVPTAISAQDLRDEDGLARQAMYAMRAGLDEDEALRAVTLTPAELLGISDRVGSLESGKQADVVVWSGRPFAATSRPVVVVVDGRVELDLREDK